MSAPTTPAPSAWSVSGLAELLRDPPAVPDLPSVPISLGRALTFGSWARRARRALLDSHDPACALRVLASLRGVRSSDLETLTLWLGGEVLGVRETALALLAAPACTELVAARVVADGGFLGFGAVRSIWPPAVEVVCAWCPADLGPCGSGWDATAAAAAGVEVARSLERFPRAAVLHEISLVFPATHPQDLRAALPHADLPRGGREVLAALLATDHRAGLRTEACLSAAEVTDYLDLARACCT